MRDARRGGFSLVELAIVAIFLGIMAAIAIPNLTRAIHRADAARIVAIQHSLALAVQTHIEDTGLIPRTGPWNTVPPDLVPYLPDNMTFSYKHVRFRYIGNRRRGRVRFRVRYPRNDPIGEALKRFRRAGSVTWNATRTNFIMDPQ